MILVEFVLVSSTAIEGDEEVMANYLAIALGGTVTTWLTILSSGTIYSWEKLCNIFRANFQGTYVRPITKNDLYRCEQMEKKTLREFVHHFSYTRNTIPKISDYDVIQAFTQGVRSRRCIEDVTEKEPETVKELMKIVNMTAKAEEVLLFVKEQPPA